MAGVSMRTLDALRMFAERVSQDMGLSEVQKGDILRDVREHAARLVRYMDERDHNRAYGILAEIEGR